MINQDLRKKEQLPASLNPIQKSEAEQTLERLLQKIPEVPEWLSKKLSSKKTRVVTATTRHPVIEAMSRRDGAKAKGVSDERAKAKGEYTVKDIDDCNEMYFGKEDVYYQSQQASLSTVLVGLLHKAVMVKTGIKSIECDFANGPTKGMMITPSLYETSSEKASSS